VSTDRSWGNWASGLAIVGATSGSSAAVDSFVTVKQGARAIVTAKETGYIAVREIFGVFNGSLVKAVDLEENYSYTIVSVEDTDFTAVGAASNTVGVTFTANNSADGTGTATKTGGGNRIRGTRTLIDITVAHP
jgi:hypothetical protein